MSNLGHYVSQSLKIFNCHSQKDVFKFTNVSGYIKVYYLNMNKKIQYVIHMFIVRLMQDNYHSGDIHFSLLDFSRHGDECIQQMAGPFELSPGYGYC